MNWACDDAQVSDADFGSVFKYVPKESTVIRMLANHNWQVEIFSQRNEAEWSRWIEDELPSIDGDDSGLILLLAKRSGEPALQNIDKTTSDDWIKQSNKESHLIPDLKRADTFSALQEKGQSMSSSAASQITSGRRGVRTVPFSRHTFEMITNSFYTHGSIARVVSRADVPIFTCDKVRMTQPAYVYNCRSSNAWEMDLALTATHFPKNGLTFATLFGCPFSIEKEIIMRLAKVKAEAAHPLLMPGIFAELERKRHTALVEEMGNKLETLIFELDFHTNDLEGPQGAQAEARSKEKREAYLDLTYFRNSLVSWNTQLAKMVQHCRQLNKEEYATTRGNDFACRPSENFRVGRTVERVEPRSSNMSRSSSKTQWFEIEVPAESEPLMRNEDTLSEGTALTVRQKASDGYMNLPEKEGIERAAFHTIIAHKEDGHYVHSKTAAKRGEDPESRFNKIREIGFKIESRLMSIRDEYDEKIRDCTMRVEGMAMSTQWSHGETNVEIALATNRDSRHMRSIALVTMIFLPGTFFASMFSMTFFNWSNDSGSPIVSTSLWIYVLITVVCTSLTIGLWYYIVVFRPSRGKVEDEEKS